MAHHSRTPSFEKLNDCNRDRPLEGGVRNIDIRKRHVARGMPKRTKKISFCANTVRKSPRPKQLVHSVISNSTGVLENKETSKIPIGPRLKNELKKVGGYGSLDLKGPSEDKKHRRLPQPAVVPDSVEDVLSQPKLHTALRVAKTLEKAKEMNPNVAKLIKSKLDSPNTAAHLRKKTASKVTIGPRKKLYQELVSVEVNEENLVKQLEEQLNMRAETVRPVSRIKDPEPQLSDYFNPEDFVRTKKVIQNIPIQYSSQGFNRTEDRDRLMIYNCLYDPVT